MITQRDGCPISRALLAREVGFFGSTQTTVPAGRGKR
jgi:hypothetical protein